MERIPKHWSVEGEEMKEHLVVWYDVETRGDRIHRKVVEAKSKVAAVKKIVSDFNQSDFFFDLNEFMWYADEDGEDDYIYEELIHEVFKKTKVIVNVVN